MGIRGAAGTGRVTSPRNLAVKSPAPSADSSVMGILQAVVMAATMILITFAWQLTLEAEAFEEQAAG